MPISKIDTPGLKADAVDNTILDLASNYAFTGTISGAGGGKILQVVSANNSTNSGTTSSTYSDTSLTASITPSATSSKVLVFMSINGVYAALGDTCLDVALNRSGADSVNGNIL